MPLNPSPTIQTGLGLVTQQLIRSDMSRAAEVTFAFSVPGTITGALAQTVINQFQTSFNANFPVIFDSQVSILKPTIKVGLGTTVPVVATATGAVTAGGTSATFMPPNVALLCKKTTVVGGRTNRGRTYFPFALPSTVVAENGTVSGSQVTAINSILSTFLSQMNAAGYPMILANKVYNQATPPRYVTNINQGNVVTSWTCESMVATQRRRLGR